MLPSSKICLIVPDGAVQNITDRGSVSSLSFEYDPILSDLTESFKSSLDDRDTDIRWSAQPQRTTPSANPLFEAQWLSISVGWKRISKTRTYLFLKLRSNPRQRSDKWKHLERDITSMSDEFIRQETYWKSEMLWECNPWFFPSENGRSPKCKLLGTRSNTLFNR